MSDVKWRYHRLKAMSIGEIVWRIQQKILQRCQKNRYYKRNRPITRIALPVKYIGLHLNSDRIPINWDNGASDSFEHLKLLGNYDYVIYKKQWAAGFQTPNKWPVDICSYEIAYAQQEDIGDIRTNWELNRHYQFAALAKSYYVSLDCRYLSELTDLFYDWNHNNLFLHGIQWISVMEIAIRVNSWIYTYCFLDKAFDKRKEDKADELLTDLSRGIQAMVSYILKHRARYSSANNHLIVEMYAVGLAGIVFNHGGWVKKAIKLLTQELQRQNYADGVNREMSLHYQSFIMEAYGLLIRAMEWNKIQVPDIWRIYLGKMSGFLADSCGGFGETVVFGDNDEGKLLDLNGGEIDYYRYVLDLMGCVLNSRYSGYDNVHENIRWLISDTELENIIKKEKYISPISNCYRMGGYTFFRSHDRRILIGIDHAELGFGKLAAHGHADALSFQLFVEGKPVFVDSGTYNYHVPARERDIVRSTASHNTVTVDQQNQSEILGAFIWGQRAKCTLLDYSCNAQEVILRAEVHYKGIRHRRCFQYNYEDSLIIKDEVTLEKRTGGKVRASFLMDQMFRPDPYINGTYRFEDDRFCVSIRMDERSTVETETFSYSAVYGQKCGAIRLSSWKEGNVHTELITKISVKVKTS